MSLKIGDMVFPNNVFMGPGLKGFYFGDDEYWFHPLIKLAYGDIWEGMNRAAKTTPLNQRDGNMEMDRSGYKPRRMFPRCIMAWPISGHMLNAVGLSSPGLSALIAEGRWHELTCPWVMTVMAVGETPEERIDEYYGIRAILESELPNLEANGAQIALQPAWACPNTGHELKSLRDEIPTELEILRPLGKPIIINVNALFPSQPLYDFQKAGLIDAISRANSLPFYTGHIGEMVTGRARSPMQDRFGEKYPGGISGPLCYPYSLRAVREDREVGITMPIITNMGHMSIGAAKELIEADVSGIVIATGAILPLSLRHVRPVVSYINQTFQEGV